MKKKIGGLIKYANLVENFPFLNPVSGKKVVEKIKRIVYKNSLKVLIDTAIDVRYDNRFFEIKTINGKRIFSKYLVLATGTAPLIPSEFKDISGFINDFDDRFFRLKNLRIAIIGGGDVAFDCALNLIKRKNQITIITRGIKAAEFLVKRSVESGVKVFYGCKIKLCVFFSNNKKFFVEFLKDDELIYMEFDYLICACGRVPYYGGIKNIDQIINALDKKLVSDFVYNEDVWFERLRRIGYDVVVSIGELEENKIGSNCGQYITAVKDKKNVLKVSYTYECKTIGLDV